MLQRTKIILWVGAALVLFVGLIVTIVVLRRPVELSLKSGDSSTQTPAELRIDETISAILGGADPTTCREAGDREAVDRCFSVIAAAQHSEDWCEKISDQKRKTRCHELSVVTRVQAGGEPDDCLSISDYEIRDACVLQAINLGVDASYCTGFSVDLQVFCLDHVRMTRSLTGDIEACAGIVDEDLRDECYASDASLTSPDAEVSEISDADGDGLTDAEESQFGSRIDRTDTDGDGLTDFVEVRTYDTNPTKADSDGDGFSDGMEVGNGYNPLGAGRL